MSQAVEAYRGITATEEFKYLEILRARASHDEAQAIRNAERRGAEAERQKWRDEKEQLHTEKEQLNTEKEQLHTEIELLRQQLAAYQANREL